MDGDKAGKAAKAAYEKAKKQSDLLRESKLLETFFDAVATLGENPPDPDNDKHLGREDFEQSDMEDFADRCRVLSHLFDSAAEAADEIGEMHEDHELLDIALGTLSGFYRQMVFNLYKAYASAASRGIAMRDGDVDAILNTTFPDMPGGLEIPGYGVIQKGTPIAIDPTGDIEKQIGDAMKQILNDIQGYMEEGDEDE